MSQENRLNLTFIPSEYWNNPLSAFKITNKKKSIPKNSSFFLLWNKNIKNEAKLEELLKNNFHTVQANKIL